ncbi:SMAD/FHA domain-containing protein [Ceraceosorus guamensis]|uniref:SMAD/FHA domain-containing protein n=1 Tax=Ceraceosorus guamensis TaxID=1522189 RepID=A0A316W2A2_9BASI|nr:SMAD/FHA domain-containing protein [Ceraceosorus guamensis]PWN43218.1 SMAD/FHA domain-containing protein [Ceraceosorus guamensis]
MSFSRDQARRKSRWEEEEAYRPLRQSPSRRHERGQDRHTVPVQSGQHTDRANGRSRDAHGRGKESRWDTGEGSTSRQPEGHGDGRSRRSDRDREGEEAFRSGPSSSYRESRARPPPRSRSRSRSPGYWERDRARERRAYDSRNAQGQAVSSAGDSHIDKDKDSQPNFESSGLLAAASNNVNGVALKYHEPPEARKPKKKWRCYVYKDGKEIDLLHISRQSVYLLGRDRAVADIPVEHPSVSKQHAVLQYRLVIKRNEFGDESKNINPFLLDLESANGTTLNGTELQPARYYELLSGDTIKFGASEREWTLLCEE